MSDPIRQGVNDAMIEALTFARRVFDHDRSKPFPPPVTLSPEATIALAEALTQLLRAQAIREGISDEAEARAHVRQWLDHVISARTLDALGEDPGA